MNKARHRRRVKLHETNAFPPASIRTLLSPAACYAVLHKQRRRLLWFTCLLVKSLGELVNRRRDLQTLLQDGLLTLEADVARPLDEAVQVTLGLDVLA
jgi:hypothetical protein